MMVILYCALNWRISLNMKFVDFLEALFIALISSVNLHFLQTNIWIHV